jgi:hypothetical protein
MVTESKRAEMEFEEALLKPLRCGGEMMFWRGRLP